jgi:hypothetical protein
VTREILSFKGIVYFWFIPLYNPLIQFEYRRISLYQNKIGLKGLIVGWNTNLKLWEQELKNFGIKEIQSWLGNICYISGLSLPIFYKGIWFVFKTFFELIFLGFAIFTAGKPSMLALPSMN